jgi:hypothetical protein
LTFRDLKIGLAIYSAHSNPVMEQWERRFEDVRVNWFPGHMAKAQKLMRARLKQASKTEREKEGSCA